jgi:hypothetical protein
VSSLHRSNSAKQAIIAHVTIGNDDTPRPISNPVTQQQLASNLHSELANRLSMSAQPSTVKSKSKTKIVHSQSNLDANPNLRSSGHSSPVFLSRDDLDGDAPKAQTRDSALLETSIPPLRVDTSGGAAEKSISSPVNSAKLDSGYVVSPASVVTSTEPPVPAHGRVFSRKTVKMEGWLDICEEATAGTWSHNWCVLEGGFIWLFDDPAESSKPKGLNKPKAMLSTAKCSVAAGAMTEKGWQAPEPDAKGPHVFALSSKF